MQSATELIRWLQTLPEGTDVGINEAGLNLLEIKPDGTLGEAYLEVGGIPSVIEYGHDSDDPPDMIECALCDKKIRFLDSYSPGDEAICAECDTEVTGRHHRAGAPMTLAERGKTIRKMVKDCLAAHVKVAVQTLAWGPHANFYIGAHRVGAWTDREFYEGHRAQFEAVERIKEKYYPILKDEVQGLEPTTD